ncbi:MAG: S24/S26 family peptidase [Vicinamibacteria bacterium]
MAELAESLLGSGWTLRLRVSGTSMKPLLRSGSVVRIAPLSLPAGPLLGDIVLLRAASGRMLAHRVIELDGHRCLTKGDASGESDGLVGRGQLLGRILGIDGIFFLPLDGTVARRIGLLLNRYYPRLVRLKAALKRRLSGSFPSLAGEGS